MSDTLRGFEILERTDVIHDPCGAAVRCDDKVIESRLDSYIEDRRVGKIALELFPAAAAVERDPHAALEARIDEIRIDRVLAHGSRGLICRKTGGDRRPRFSEVARLEDIRCVVAAVMTIDRGKSGAICDRRRGNRLNASERRHAWRRHVLPVLSAVARQLDETIVGTGPYLAALDGRAFDVENRV